MHCGWLLLFQGSVSQYFHRSCRDRYGRSPLQSAVLLYMRSYKCFRPMQGYSSQRLHVLHLRMSIPAQQCLCKSRRQILCNLI